LLGNKRIVAPYSSAELNPGEMVNLLVNGEHVGNATLKPRQRVRFTMIILYGFLFHRKMNVRFMHEDVETELLDFVKDVEDIDFSDVAIHEREGFIRKKWNDLKELTARKMSIKVNYSVDIFQVNAETKKKDFTATEKPLTLVINFLNLSLSFLMKMTGSVSIYGFFSSAK